jgi:type I restriction-modification system DNA methylase subunit
MFHGFDFDNTMLRIGSMNMLLHGVENPDRYRDSPAQDHAGEEEKYTLVLANPPFAGSLDYENTAKDLLQIVNRSLIQEDARSRTATRGIGLETNRETRPGLRHPPCHLTNYQSAR